MNSKKKQSSVKTNRRRQIQFESLESRELLAADLVPMPVPPIAGQSPVELHAAEAATETHFVGDGHDHDHPGHDHLDHEHHEGDEHVHDHDDECCCEACRPVAHSHDHNDESLRVTPDGRTYFVDPAPQLDPEIQQELDALASLGESPENRASATMPLNVPVFHSNPTASKKIFLDFDGFTTVPGDSWNSFNSNSLIHSVPYSVDGDIDNFSAVELNNIALVYERVAEDFAAFNVDVTTEDPGANLFGQGGEAIRVVISTDRDDTRVGGTGNRWYSNAGGVAFLNSWYNSIDSPVWVFYNNLGSAKSIAEASSHEVGHAFGLRHDGDDVGAYYGGHGGGETRWAPIMGVGYNSNLTQWSRGEYPDANNGENDVNVLRNALQYRSDDYTNTNSVAAAFPLHAPGATTVDVAGIIERATDVDVFRLDITEDTQVTLDFSGTLGPNLDMEVQLFDSSGTLLETSNEPALLGASIDRLLSAGSYTIVLDGVGRPAAGNYPGYSDYASFGQYFITGTLAELDPVDGGPVVVAAPTANDPVNVTSVAVDFNQPLDESSFSLADVTQFIAPDGSDLASTLTGFTFVTPQQVAIEFANQSIGGTYTMTIGPDILDPDGLMMDQNQNGVPGESGDDYTFTFDVEIDSAIGQAPNVAGFAVDDTTAASYVTFTFDQRMDPTTFDLSDINFFEGPSVFSLNVTEIEWLNLETLKLSFDTQTAPGVYQINIGPNIEDLEGLLMDQNQDGTSGIPVSDWYFGSFELGNTSVAGDFDGDGDVDALDIDLLCVEVNAGTNNASFDLTGDGLVDASDHDELIVGVIGTLHGDANLDFVVDVSDFNLWNANKFSSDGGWAGGDFNCDGLTDVSDFNIWNTNKFQSGSGAVLASFEVDADDDDRAATRQTNVVDRVWAEDWA